MSSLLFTSTYGRTATDCSTEIPARKQKNGVELLVNVIEKILAKASGNKEVRPGDVVVANIDLMVMHDLSANFVMKVFENEIQCGKIADPSRIAFVFDHNFAPASEQAAEALASVRPVRRQTPYMPRLRRWSGKRASCHHRKRPLDARPDHYWM